MHATAETLPAPTFPAGAARVSVRQRADGTWSGSLAGTMRTCRGFLRLPHALAALAWGAHHP